MEGERALIALQLAEGENQRRALLGDVLGNISEVATKATELSSIMDQLFKGTEGLLNERLFAFFQVRGEYWELMGAEGELADSFGVSKRRFAVDPIKDGYGTDEVRRDVASQDPDLAPYMLNEAQLESLELQRDVQDPKTCLLYPIGDQQHPLGALLLLSLIHI